MVQNALLKVDNSRADALLPDLTKDQGLGHGVIGDLLCRDIGILCRVSQSLRVRPRLIEVKENEKETVSRRHGEHVRVILVMHDRQISVTELWDWAGRDHETFPVCSDGYASSKNASSVAVHHPQGVISSLSGLTYHASRQR